MEEFERRERRKGGRKIKKNPNFISKLVFEEPTTERYMIWIGRHTKTKRRHRSCLTTNRGVTADMD